MKGNLQVSTNESAPGTAMSESREYNTHPPCPPFRALVHCKSSSHTLFFFSLVLLVHYELRPCRSSRRTANLHSLKLARSPGEGGAGPLLLGHLGNQDEREEQGLTEDPGHQALVVDPLAM